MELGGLLAKSEDCGVLDWENFSSADGDQGSCSTGSRSDVFDEIYAISVVCSVFDEIYAKAVVCSGRFWRNESMEFIDR